MSFTTQRYLITVHSKNRFDFGVVKYKYILFIFSIILLITYYHTQTLYFQKKKQKHIHNESLPQHH